MAEPEPSNHAVPKIIWSVWFQGWENAPDLIRACRASWERHNPGWEHRFLDGEDDAARLLSSISDLVNRSDLLRLELLSQLGGVWVDATAYCLRPLDEWLEQRTTSGFFAYDRPAPNRLLSNWFLASEPRSPLVQAWRDAAFAYWDHRTKADDYFWSHRLIGDLYENDPTVRAIWDAAPRLLARGPHAFTPYDKQLLGSVTNWHREVVERSPRQMLKLSRHIDHSKDVPGTLYRWLCDREGI